MVFKHTMDRYGAPGAKGPRQAKLSKRNATQDHKVAKARAAWCALTSSTMARVVCPAGKILAQARGGALVLGQVPPVWAVSRLSRVTFLTYVVFSHHLEPGHCFPRREAEPPLGKRL